MRSRLLVCLIVLAACGDNGELPVDGLEVTPGEVAVPAGETTTVLAEYTAGDDRFAADDVTWSTSGADTATVDGNGAMATITAVAPGSVVIRAAGEGFTATVRVTVGAAEMTAITIEPESPTVANGTTSQLAVTAAFTDG